GRNSQRSIVADPDLAPTPTSQPLNRQSSTDTEASSVTSTPRQTPVNSLCSIVAEAPSAIVTDVPRLTGAASSRHARMESDAELPVARTPPSLWRITHESRGSCPAATATASASGGLWSGVTGK